ncbi:MAG: hypothetical protein IJ746_00150 [Ruminococcus sp.]|nr:hypothetical protein [Ruminococcus sp.]
MIRSPLRLFVSFVLAAVLNTVLLLVMDRADASVRAMVAASTGLCTLWVLYAIFGTRCSSRKERGKK